MMALASLRSWVGSSAVSTSASKVTMPTYTSSGTVSRNALAAAFAPSKRPRSAMLSLVSTARMVVRRTCSVASPAGSPVDLRAVSPMETEMSSGWTSAPSGTETSTWMVPSDAGLHVTDRQAAARGVRRSAAEGEREARGEETEGESSHQMPSIAKSIGSTVTLACAIFSRNLGRRPVDFRRPRVRPSSSKPAAWS